MSNMTPREIVHELDSHIVGQSEAKRAPSQVQAQELYRDGTLGSIFPDFRIFL